MKKRKDGYLMLGRGRNERIMIETSDGLIEIVVAEIRRHPLTITGDSVSIGIRAPRRIQIAREELHRQGFKGKGVLA